MAKKGCWFKGALYGCGGCLLIVLLVFGGIAAFFGNVVSGLGNAAETGEELEARFGDLDDFTPDPAAPVQPARLELFLQVREAIHEQRTSVADKIALLENEDALEERLEGDTNAFEKMGAIGDVLGSAFGMGAAIGPFIAARNEALLEREMGLGEYAWYDLLVYGDGRRYEVPADAPSLGGDDDSRIRTGRREMLRRLGAAMEAAGIPLEDPLRLAVVDEIYRIDEDERAQPFTEKLPEPWAALIDPVQDRAAAVYRPEVRVMELGRTREGESFSFTVD